MPTLPPPPTVSVECDSGHHGVCSHRAGPLGFTVSLTSGDRCVDRLVPVCVCGCHDSCALKETGDDGVREAAWRRLCTCPGAPADWTRIDTSRAERRERQEASKRRRAIEQKIAREIRESPPGRTAAEIRADVISSLQKHGVEWPQTKIDLAVEVTLARSGNRWLAAPRILNAAFREVQNIRSSRKPPTN